MEQYKPEKQKPSFLKNAKTVIQGLGGAAIVYGLAYTGTNEFIDNKELSKLSFSERYDATEELESDDAFNGKKCFTAPAVETSDDGTKYLRFTIEGDFGMYVTTNEQIINFVQSNKGVRIFLKKDESGEGLSIIDESGNVLEDVK